MKTHVASYFLFLPLFYFLDGVEIGDFSFITRPFSHNSEFKTSAAYRRLNGKRGHTPFEFVLVLVFFTEINMSVFFTLLE